MRISTILRNMVIIILLLTAANAWAVNSSLWETQSGDDFDAGDPENVSILPAGQVVLGPQIKIVSTDELFAWTLETDSRGNVFAGTGNDGKILRVSPGGDYEVFAKLELQQVFALAADAGDTLYAGGFPGGKVYSINTRGEVAEYFDTGQDSIWSLRVNKDGVLFELSTGSAKITAPLFFMIQNWKRLQRWRWTMKVICTLFPHRGTCSCAYLLKLPSLHPGPVTTAAVWSRQPSRNLWPRRACRPFPARKSGHP